MIWHNAFLGLGVLVVTCATATAATDSDFSNHRFGGLEVIALRDVPARTGAPKPELLVGLPDADKAKYLVDGGMDNSINCFVARVNGMNLLFDTGLGARGNGMMAASLGKAGMKPSDIDAVLITHFHGDHIGGLLDNGAAAFPNADLYVPRVEAEKWNPDQLGFLAVYGDRAKTFEWGSQPLSGVTAVEAAGHTPGHTVFLLESGGGKLLIIADTIHFQNIQLPLPDVAVTYDTDPVRAVAARKQVFNMAVRQKLPVAGMHLRFPGIGLLAGDESGYVLGPVTK